MKVKDFIKHTSIYKYIYYPIRVKYVYFLSLYFPQKAAKNILSGIMSRKPDLVNPKDLNEKINYLKFHTDLNEWARLADKYLVREYVKSRGLESILIPLLAKFSDTKSFAASWDTLPNSFIIKSNIGCGDNIIVKDKSKTCIDEIIDRINKWDNTKKEFIFNVEPHYTIQKNRLILVEELLVDKTGLSSSMIDYKIWCFNGNPYNIFLCVDRDVSKSTVSFVLYDLKWNKQNEKLARSTVFHGAKDIDVPKPENLDYMLECAAILSKGHPQCRVDLYNVNGKVYFGEMTMSSQGGYMDYFTPEYLLEMGQQFEVK